MSWIIWVRRNLISIVDLGFSMTRGDETLWLEELLGFSVKPSHGGKPVATPKRSLESSGFSDESFCFQIVSTMLLYPFFQCVVLMSPPRNFSQTNQILWERAGFAHIKLNTFEFKKAML